MVIRFQFIFILNSLVGVYSNIEGEVEYLVLWVGGDYHCFSFAFAKVWQGLFFFNPSPSPAPRVYAILYLLLFLVAIVQLFVLCALRSFLTNITESVGEIYLLLIMFNCPFCKKIVEVSSRLDVGRHVRMHIRTLDYPVAFPIKCCQHRCHASYSSLDSFVKHVNKKHSRQYSGAVPVADDCNMLDDDLPDTHNERDMTYLQ